jgi:MFS transporter, DHA2 family, multidrug resistance protein
MVVSPKSEACPGREIVYAAELTNYLVSKGFTGPDASAAANGCLYHQLQNQATLLSFMDCFRVIAWLTLGTAALLLLVQRFKPAGKPQSAH